MSTCRHYWNDKTWHKSDWITWRERERKKNIKSNLSLSTPFYGQTLNSNSDWDYPNLFLWARDMRNEESSVVTKSVYIMYCITHHIVWANHLSTPSIPHLKIFILFLSVLFITSLFLTPDSWHTTFIFQNVEIQVSNVSNS